MLIIRNFSILGYVYVVGTKFGLKLNPLRKFLKRIENNSLEM
jgi:hypothetical protein